MAQTPPSQWADLDGPVHYVDFGGPPDGPLLVCVHGLGGSHVNWAAVAPGLVRHCRVVALDLAGFGHTPGSGRSTSVAGNQRLVHRFLTEVVGGPAILVGNSMGGLISALEASTHPEAVAGTVLVDPALPPHLRTAPDPQTLAMFTALFVPGLGRVLMAGRAKVRTAEDLAMDTLRLCCVDPGRVPEQVLRAHLDLAGSRRYYEGIQQEFVTATRSMLRLLARRRRYAAMLRSIRGPVLLLHGEKDRLVQVGAARAAARANPHWQFAVAPDIGHVPQLEAAPWVVEQVLGWLDGAAAGAAAATRGARSVPDAPSLP